MLAHSLGAEKTSWSVYECAYEYTEAFYWAERRPADPLALIEKLRDTAVTLREGEQSLRMKTVGMGKDGGSRRSGFKCAKGQNKLKWYIS